MLELVGEGVARRVGDQLPPPSAAVAPVVRGGSWCDSMERAGWPDRTGVRLEDLGPTARPPVLVILRYGAQHCGWRVTTGVPTS